MMKFPLRMEPGCELSVLGSSKHRSLCQRSQRHSGVFAKNLTVRCFQVGEYLAFYTESIAKKLPIRYSLTIRKCFESTLQVRRFTILKMFFINIPNFSSHPLESQIHPLTSLVHQVKSNVSPLLVHWQGDPR